MGDCCEALPRGAMGLSAVCECGISSSYSITIFIAISSLWGFSHIWCEV